MRSNKQLAHNRLDKIVSGYRASQILFTANRLEVFSTLDRQTMSLEELAGALRSDLRGTRILCDALVALGLLERSRGRYRNTAVAREFLLPTAARSQNALLRHGAGLYERWGRLYDVVRTGKPVPRDSTDPRLRGDERAFAQAMASSASLSARETAARTNLNGVKSLLDIGGGPGIYAIEFARRYPHLKAVVFDNAATLEVAQSNIARAGLTGRISLRAGDAFKDDLGAGYDFILLSNVIHSYASQDNQRLISRVALALAPGGRLGIKDFLLHSTRTGPTWASLFAVNMLVSTEGGDCYSVGEIKQWLCQAGLAFDGLVKLSPPSRMVVGRKLRG